MTPRYFGSHYIYSFNFNINEADLFRLEARQLFENNVNKKFLFSDLIVDPCCSPFIKSRFDISFSSNKYPELLKKIEDAAISKEEFKVEYLVLEDDETLYAERLNKLRDIGYRIDGEPNYDSPKVTYGICFFENYWYFGILNKHNADWQKHKEMPQKFSNSISNFIAKALVNLATKGDTKKNLIDVCCGVGTVMLEASIAGINIEGCDINWKACKNSRLNLSHFGYSAEVFCSDISKITKKYDAAIIDLPYNHTTYSDDEITDQIITSTTRLTNRIVIVSITDISEIIEKVGFRVTDYCAVEKPGKSRFARKIWVCEREKA